MWKLFEIFAIISLVTWALSVPLSLIKSKTITAIHEILIAIGIISLTTFITLLWIDLDRAPMRTLGETRLWYSLFLAATGFLIYKRWNYRAISTYSVAMALLFLLINYLKPEYQSKTLMPALQSVWFVPHVIVYMIAYAVLGLTCILGFLGLIKHLRSRNYEELINKADNLVYIGFGFLTLGLTFGALWAKEAWGHYWTWDPKETWAFITWAVYLIYIHFKIYKKVDSKTLSLILLFAFIILLICWFGINYLPAAQNSVHVYSN